MARTRTAAASPSAAADDVEAVVQPVDEVDIGPARRPEHDARAGRPPGARVAGTILRTAIGFGLHDATDPQSGAIVTHDDGPQQAPGHVGGRASQLRPVDRLERCHDGGSLSGGRAARGSRGQGQIMTSRTSGGRIGPRIGAEDAG